MTTTQQAFLDRRRVGLGGSDLGAILGLSAWRTGHDVWLDKTGRAAPDADSLPLRFGSFAEEFIAQEYCRTTGNRVERFNTLLQHPTAPIVGNVDRLVVPPGAKRASHMGRVRTDRVLECKTAAMLRRDSAWGEAGTDQIPETYLIQAATYLLLTGCDWVDLAVLVGGSLDFRIYTIGRDAELEAMLIDEATRWWTDYVLGDTPPPPQTEGEARQRWSAHRPGTTIELDETAADDLRELARLKAEIREREKREQGIRDSLIPKIADAETIAFQGAPLATFKANKPSPRINWQGIATELNPPPDLLARHTVNQPGARVLRFTREIAQ